MHRHSPYLFSKPTPKHDCQSGFLVILKEKYIFVKKKVFETFTNVFVNTNILLVTTKIV